MTNLFKTIGSIQVHQRIFDSIFEDEVSSDNSVSTLQDTPLVRKKRQAEKWNPLTTLRG
jgi:hypothetical protein